MEIELICPNCLMNNCIIIKEIVLGISETNKENGDIYIKYLCNNKENNNEDKYILLNEYLLLMKNKSNLDNCQSKSKIYITIAKDNINKETAIKSMNDFYDLYRSNLVQYENNINFFIDRMSITNKETLLDKVKQYNENNRLIYQLVENILKIYFRYKDCQTYSIQQNYNFIINHLKPIPTKVPITNIITLLNNRYYSSLYYILKLRQVYLRRVNKSKYNIQFLQGHSLPITSLCELRSGVLASGSLKTLNFWHKDPVTHIFTSKPIQFKLENSLVTSIIELEDNIIAFGIGKEIKEFNCISNTFICIYQGHSNQVESIIAIKDNKYLCSAGIDRTIKTWNRENQQCINSVQSPSNKFINSLLYFTYHFKNIHNEYVISCEDEIVVYSLQDDLSFQRIQHLDDHKTIVKCLYLLPNNLFASSGYAKTIYIYKYREDFTKFTLFSKLKGHKEAVFSMLLAKNGSFLSGSSDRTVKIWDLNSCSCLCTFNLGRGHVSFIIQLNDGRVCTASNDTLIRVFNEIVPMKRNIQKGNCYGVGIQFRYMF